MTEVHVTGEFMIASEVVLKTVGNTKVASLSGLVVESVGHGEVKKDIFSYFELELWDSAAEYVAANVIKGYTIIIKRGTLRQNRWEKDGINHQKVIIRVNSFRLIKKVI